jgi:hypothetical protein
MDTKRQLNLRDEIFLLAVANGCEPFYAKGVFGSTWHCNCPDNRHAIDQQYSTISLTSARGHK